MDYTFLQFMTFLNIVERQESFIRMSFVSDLAAVVGGMFGGTPKGGAKSPLQEHLGSLEATYYEEE